MARTPQTQRAIIKLLEEEHLLSAPQIFDILKNRGLVLNKTTVYRAIDKLLFDEIICRQVFGESTPRYELRHDHHDHFICEKCGRVEKITCDDVSFSSTSRYSVSHHHVTLMGSCRPKCRK